MDKKKIERINALARKAKTEGLTESEKNEQAALRTEYRMAVIGNLSASLKNVKIKEKDGTIHDLKPKKSKGH